MDFRRASKTGGGPKSRLLPGITLSKEDFFAISRQSFSALMERHGRPKENISGRELAPLKKRK